MSDFLSILNQMALITLIGMFARIGWELPLLIVNQYRRLFRRR